MENQADFDPDDSWKQPSPPEHVFNYETFIKKHVSQISEYLDTVQIVCTRLMPDGTTEYYAYGSGNIYARRGSLEDWLRKTA